jgi:hypothetical protein
VRDRHLKIHEDRDNLTLRAELFTEPEGEYGEIEVEQEYWRRPAGFVGHGWRGA